MTMQRFLAATEVLRDREVAVIASTGGVKRDLNDIVPSGIDLTNFRRNPIVPWQHSPDSPVGCAIAIGVVGGELRARIEFAPLGVSSLADQCCSLVKAGVIRSVSIGFDAKEMQPIDKAKPRGGQKILRCELLEISFVSVPADPDAMVIERAVQGDVARFASLRRCRGGPTVRSCRTRAIHGRCSRPGRPTKRKSTASPRGNASLSGSARLVGAARINQIGASACRRT